MVWMISSLVPQTPGIINASGLAGVIEVPLSEREQAKMKASADTLKKVTQDGLAALK